ncbi:MAG: hypothetical protein ACE5IR_24675 [bacterium]
MKKTIKPGRPISPIQKNLSAKGRAIGSVLAALFCLATAQGSAHAEVDINYEIGEDSIVLRVRKDLGAPISFAAVDQTFGGNVINSCVTDNAPSGIPCSMINGEELRISLRITSDVLRLRVELPLVFNAPEPPGPPPSPIPPAPLLSPPMSLVCLPEFGIRLRVDGDSMPIVTIPEVTDCSRITLPEFPQ